MKLSKASDYALVLLAKLVDQPTDQWTSARAIAEPIGIPQSFVGNIVHRLVQVGILQSQRGNHGGIRLAKDASQITIGHVLNALEERMNLVECMEQPGSCPIEGNCEVRAFWSITQELILAALKHITLKDIYTYMNATKQKGVLRHVETTTAS